MCQALSLEGWQLIMICLTWDGVSLPTEEGGVWTRQGRMQPGSQVPPNIAWCFPPHHVRMTRCVTNTVVFIECEGVTSNVKLCSRAFPEELFFFLAVVYVTGDARSPMG